MPWTWALFIFAAGYMMSSAVNSKPEPSIARPVEVVACPEDYSFAQGGAGGSSVQGSREYQACLKACDEAIEAGLTHDCTCAD